MNRSDKGESLLIQRIQEGEDYAFEIVFLKYREPLCRYIWKFVRSTALAEEIVQDVFTDLWDGKNTLNVSGHLRGLLFEIARNKALDHIKHKKVVEQYLLEAKQYRDEELQINLLMTEGRDAHSFDKLLKELMNELPPKGRQIFELNRNEGLTYLEISEYLDISVKTVETHMRRAFQKLRERLKKYMLLFVIGSAAIWNLSRVFM